MLTKGTIKVKGFTLIELLVVLFVIGVAVTFILPSISGGQNDRRLEEEAKRIFSLIKLAKEEAVFQSKEVGVQLQDDAYSFWNYEETGWQPHTEAMYRERQLEIGRLDLSIEDRSIKLELPTSKHKHQEPQIIFFSSGECTPFELILYSDQVDAEYRIEGSLVGVIKLYRNNRQLK